MSDPSVGPGLGPDGRQKAVIGSILSLIETGKLPSPDAYRTCTILSDGAGISYGKHQATDRSGSVDAIMLEYALSPGAAYAAEIEPFLPMVASDFSSRVDPADPPKEVLDLMAVLRKCGRDPVMWRVQDEIFDELYWLPALRAGQKIGLQLPLSYLLVYDTTIQSGIGGISIIRSMFPALPPSLGGRDERVWATQYANARKKFLEQFSSSNKKKQAAVRASAYRINAILSDLIEPGNWLLAAPLTFRGVKVS